MQRYVEGSSREQIQVVSLDDLIGEDNPARVFDAFVDSLDMKKLGFKYAQTKETGRKPENPADMCKLYIYGYFNGIRSSRKIEKECKRNIEVMWLINNLTPHNKTISDFRKDNKKPLENLFKEFTMLCDMMGLIGKEMIAIDGSKFRASNSRKKNFTRNKVKKMIQHYEDSAKKYMELLENSDKNDSEQKPDFTKEDLNEKLKNAQKRIEELKEMSEEIEKTGDISITDKDAKHMGVSNNGTDISHNVQVAVDSKNHLVVAVDVISAPADQGQLYNVAKLAADELRIELKNNEEENDETKENNSEDYILTVLADKGYYEYESLKECLEAGIKTIVSKQKSPNNTGDEKYVIDNFIYDKERDVYICPQAKILYNVSKSTSKEHKYKNTSICKECTQRDQCTKKVEGRTIIRSEKHDIYDIVNKITKDNMYLYKKRQQIVEHPFGTIKRALGYTYFLTRGNASVRVESFMHFFIYNLKRVINIMGVKALIEYLKPLILQLLYILLDEIFYRIKLV